MTDERVSAVPGPGRHTPGFYDQRDELVVLEVGDRFFVECEGGGPSTSRLETFPPRVEIAEPGGTYVLADDGPRHDWRYVWIPDRR